MTGLAEVVGSWRAALRLAARSARRERWRSLLLVAVLAVPVFAGGYLLAADSATLRTPERTDSWRLGSADLKVSVTDLNAAGHALPAGSRTSSIVSGRTIVDSSRGMFATAYIGADPSDPLTEGLFVIRQGREPRSAGEVAVSSAMRERLAVDVGQLIDAGMPERRLVVVGVVDATEALGRESLLVPAQWPLSPEPHEAALVDLSGAAEGWLPPSGVGYTPPASLDPAERAQRLAAVALVAGFAAFQVVLLVGAAFAMSARRQQRDLAILAAMGATRAQVGRVVLAKGVMLGAAAGVLGLGLAATTFYTSESLLERLTDHPVADGVPVLSWMVLWSLAVVLGGLAALGPARGLSARSLAPRLSHREVAGSRTSRRLTWLGLGLLAVGAVVVLYSVHPEVAALTPAVGGAGLVLCGLAALSPGLVSVVGRLSARAALPARLALRHASRHRLRNGAAVAAVCAAFSGSVGMSLFLAADTSTAQVTNASTGQVLLPPEASGFLTEREMSRLAAILSARRVVRLEIARDTTVLMARHTRGSGHPPVDPPQQVAVGGDDVVRAVVGRALSETERGALARDHALVFYPELYESGSANLGGAGEELERERVALPATLLALPQLYRELPGAVVSPATAAQLGLTTTAGRVIFDVDRVPASAELDRTRDLVFAAQLRAGADAPAAPVELTVGRPNTDEVTSQPMVYALAMASVVVAVFATGLAVALSNAEMRDEMAILAAVGGGPLIRRLIAACQAGLVVGLGTVLGVVAGFAPAAGLFAARPDLTWHVPWWGLAITVVAAPSAAITGTIVFTRSTLELARRID